MAIRGNFGAITNLKAALRAMPISVAHAMAPRAAEYMTAQARQAFDTGVTVYGDARPAGADGQRVGLVRTGATRAGIQFVSAGTIVRCVLGPKYARYLIGTYRILPMGALPVRWGRGLSDIAREACAQAVKAA